VRGEMGAGAAIFGFSNKAGGAFPPGRFACRPFCLVGQWKRETRRRDKKAPHAKEFGKRSEIFYS